LIQQANALLMGFVSVSIAMMGELLDVMDEAIELPLRIGRGLTSQGEASQFLVMSQVREHRFDGGNPTAYKHLLSSPSILCFI